MVSIKRKSFWKQLAPKPYSSLWIWFACRSYNQHSPDYYLPHGLGYSDDDVVDDDDDDYSYANGDTHGPLDAGYYGEGSTDWLDSTLASLDESTLDLSNCVVQSIPVVNYQLQSTGYLDKQINSSKSGISRVKLKDSKKRKIKSENNTNSDSNRSPKRKLFAPEEVSKEIDEIEEELMKILPINESHTIIVLKKVRNNKQFSIINGDAKVTTVVGSVVCDGYFMEMEKSAYISTGFGSYQIIIDPVKYQSYPSKEHLFEILENSSITVNESIRLEIVDYLANRDSSLSECIILSFQKWRWPVLTALRLFIHPELSFPHWLQVSFAEVKSPVTQWSSMLQRLTQEVKKKTELAVSRPVSKSSTRGPRIIMLGGTNAGKSSLTRHTCNQIISSVTDAAFIVDCDPGQSEFSPPGIINVIRIKDPILSPPFVNCLRFNKDLIASCSVAGIAITNNPDLYIMGIKHLWKTFLDSLSDEDSCKPVIINTIGWTQGLGIHLMVDVLNIFQPNYVIEIKRQWGGRDNFPFDCNPDTLNQLDGWLVKPRRESKITEQSSSECSLLPYLNYDYIRICNQFNCKRIPAENRQNRIRNQLAYFCLMDEIMFKSLFELEMVSLNLENLYFHVQHEFVIDKHLIPHVIKDSWVHLCSISNPESDLQSSETHPSTSSSSINVTPVPSSVPPGFSASDADPSIWETSTNDNLKILPFLRENKCLGSAIVRDIDLKNKKLILLTPESPERIAQVNCIVRPQGIFIPDQLQLVRINQSNNQSTIHG